MRHASYLVIRSWGARAAELFGPLASTPRLVVYDVERLYAREGATLHWVAWSRATAAQRRECVRRGCARLEGR